MKKLIKPNSLYQIEGNIIHFISTYEERPLWSKKLHQWHIQNQENLHMKRRYKFQKQKMLSNERTKRFVEFVNNEKGVKVDLASGPSGYFAPCLEALVKTDVFIVTDACPTIIDAHARACNLDNFYVFDVDLDKPLPFVDESVDIFTGNLLNNVNDYANLLKEAYRCLKPNGKLAIIEMFFEHGCKTYEFLKQKNAVWASFETFIAFCEQIGFTCINSEIINTRKGKISVGDLFPLDNNDISIDRVIYLIKS